MYLLPLIISSLFFVCHALVFPEASQTLYENKVHVPWKRLTTMYEYYQNLEKLHEYEELLHQYRMYLINSIYENNNDICYLFDYITDSNDKSNESEKWKINENVDDNKVFSSNIRKKRSNLENPTHHQTAIDTYIDIVSSIKDRNLYIELLKKLQHTCLANEDGTYFKRDGTKIIGKKQKFHSWGGKRDNRGKDPLKDQVIPRSYPPFHSWGGK
uniref:CSON000586 protein n=1 Tax=Culicoides sonorensis TaxID=179676 RepID=A0A336MSG2_CULSO